MAQPSMRDKKLQGSDAPEYREIGIDDPVAYLDSSRYPILYEGLIEYINNQNVVVPQMGEKDETIKERFRDTVRTYFRRTLKLTTSKPQQGDVENRLEEAVSDMVALCMGYGPLQNFMQQKENEEIIVRNGSILIERGGRILVIEDNTNNPLRRQILDQQFTILARRIADLGKIPISDKRPYAVTVVPDTLDRIGVIIPPLAHDYVAINIRVFPKTDPFDLYSLQEQGTFANKQEFQQNVQNIIEMNRKKKLEAIKREIKGESQGDDQRKKQEKKELDKVKGKKNTEKIVEVAKPPKYDAFLTQYIEEKRRKKKSNADMTPAKAVYEMARDKRINQFLDSIPDDDAREEFENMSKLFGWKVAMFLGYIAYLNLATVLVAGEFSSGKTTILNAMSGFIRDDVSPVVLEDYLELKIPHKYVLRLVTYKQPGLPNDPVVDTETFRRSARPATSRYPDYRTIQ